jgi:predicted nucleic acid-binding protein
MATKSPTRFLVDTSVWARLATTPEVADELRKRIESGSPNDLLVCPPVALEYGFTARTGTEHSRLREHLAAFTECPEHPTEGEALDVQGRLWNGGLLRAAGATDTLIAAYAIKNNATVLHYDRDFEHIASAVPAFRQRWILPRGSVD